MTKAGKYQRDQPLLVDPRRVIGRLRDHAGRASGRSLSPDPVPGPLGAWQKDVGRPYSNIGKFGFGLTPGAPGLEAGGGGAFAVRTRVAAPGEGLPGQVRPAQPGFFESALGGLFGVTGDVPGGFGRFLGSVIDFPFEATGNAITLAAAPLNSTFLEARNAPLDADLRASWDESIRENPLNGLLRLGEFARYQWERDSANGKFHGLLSDIGPAANPWDMLMNTLNLILMKPGQAIERTLLVGGLHVGEDRLAAVERMAQELETDDKYYDDPLLTEMATKLKNGQYGALGSQAARDAILDDMVLNFGVTGDFWGDLGLSLISDPWILLSFGLGAVVKGAAKASVAMSSEFLRVLAVADPSLKLSNRAAQAAIDFIKTAARVGDAEAAALFRGDATIHNRALVHVAGLDEFKAYAVDLHKAARMADQWKRVIEPAIRPIFNVVDRVNSFPFIFGKRGPAAGVIQTIANRWSTEGVINGLIGLSQYAKVSSRIRALSSGVWSALENGLGIYTANAIRLGQRPDLIARAQRQGFESVLGTTAHAAEVPPTELAAEGLVGLRGKDLAQDLEIQQMRHKNLSLAAAGGVEAGREGARARMVLVGLDPEVAAAEVAKMGRDEVALIYAAYFGHIINTFHAAVRAAPKSVSRAARKRLTLIGPSQITDLRAAPILAALDANDVATVRAAVRQYDLLYDNLNELVLKDSDLMLRVRLILEDNIAKGALPKEVASGTKLGKPLKKWRQANEELGYVLGEKPPDDQLWRATTMEVDGKQVLVAINPWIDLTDGVSEAVGKVSWVRSAKSRYFRGIRGQRIMYDARNRMAIFAGDKYGITHGESDAIFAQVMKAADDFRVTPRALSGPVLFQIVQHSKLASDVLEKFSVEEAVELVLRAFKGEFWHVGASQAFTGAAKEMVGGRSNWLGVIAEDIYPKVRYQYNPVFQLQELVEPFFLNTMRGVMPGFRASDLDKQTLDLDAILIHKGGQHDDQIERGVSQLWDAQASKIVAGVESRFGRLARKVMPNVRAIKEVNYVRLQRHLLGEEFHRDIVRTSPETWFAMEAAYGTTDAGEIAVRFLSERAGLRAREGLGWTKTLLDLLKPYKMGKLEPVVWERMVSHFPEVATDALGLRSALRVGGLTKEKFERDLLGQGADAEFVKRAYREGVFPEPDEWWENFGRIFPGKTAEARAFLQVRAAAANETEAEYLSRRFADVPMSADAEELAALAAQDRSALDLAVRVRLSRAGDPAGGGALESVQAQVRGLQNEAGSDAFETLRIVDPATNRVVQELRSTYDPYSVDIPSEYFPTWLNGSGDGAGKAFLHTHPVRSLLSGNDIATAALVDSSEMLATPRGAQSVMLPGTNGWATARFVADAEAGVIEHNARRIANRSPYLRPIADVSGMKWGQQATSMEEVHEFLASYYSWFNEMLYGPETGMRAVGRPFSDPRGMVGAISERLHRDLLGVGSVQEYELLLNEAGIQRLAQHIALDDLATRYDWVHEYRLDRVLPPNERQLQLLLERAYATPPKSLQFAVGQSLQGGATTRVLDQWALTFETNPGGGSMRGDWIPWDADIMIPKRDVDGKAVLGGDGSPVLENMPMTAAEKTAVTDRMEPGVRRDLQDLLAVKVSHARHDSVGWWDEGEGGAPNTVYRSHGPRAAISAATKLVGVLDQQTEVIATRRMRMTTVANRKAGQRWAIEIRSTRDLDGAGVAALAALAKKAGVPDWGFTPVAEGATSTTLRFVWMKMPGTMAERDFVQAVDLATIHANLFDAVHAVERANLGVATLEHNVMDTITSRNDWGKRGQRNGEAHLQSLARETNGRVGRGVVNRRVAHQNRTLHTVLQDVLGEERYASHLAAVRARGGRLPEADLKRVRKLEPDSQTTVAPSITLPDRFSFFVPGQPMNVWEQHILASQRIDALAFYESLPSDYMNVMESIWGSKLRDDLDLNVATLFNAFLIGALSANTSLAQTEALASRWRAVFGNVLEQISPLGVPQHSVVPPIMALRELREDALRAQRRLPLLLADNPQQMGLAAQVQRQWRLTAEQLERMPEQVFPPGVSKRALLEMADEAERFIADAVASGTSLREAVDFINKPVRIPVEAGTTPVPPGTIRAYHFTRSLESLASIRKNGLDRKFARGETYGEPNQIWFSTTKPHNDQAYVEVFLKPEDIGNGDGGSYLFDRRNANPDPALVQGEIDTMHARKATFAVQADRIPPEQIITYHEPGFEHYNYLVKEYGKPGSAKAAENVDKVREIIEGVPDPVALRAYKQWVLDVKRVGVDSGHIVAVPWNLTGDPASERYVSIASPLFRARGENTNVQMGRVMLWLTNDLFTPQTPGMQQFLRKQAWETRDQFMVRVGSILPGIGGKTATFATAALGPALSRRGAQDVWMSKALYLQAKDEGWWDDFAKGLTPTFRARVEAAGKATLETGQGQFLAPEMLSVKLGTNIKSRWQANPDGALRAMRVKLHDSVLLTDAEKAMYTDDVLAAMARTNDEPAILVYGGDYEAMDKGLARLQVSDAAALEAAGWGVEAQRMRDWTLSQFQWHKWQQVRGGRDGFLDPHIMLTKQLDHVRRLPDLNVQENLDIGSVLDPYAEGAAFDPLSTSMRFAQRDGQVQGASVVMDDLRRLHVGTKHADSITGLHELMHGFEEDLHPSAREMLLDVFRQETGSKRLTWNNDVREWFVEQVLKAIEAKKITNPKLREPIAYFAKLLKAQTQREQRVAQTAAEKVSRAEALEEARGAVVSARTTVGPLKTALDTATRGRDSAVLALQRARGRLGVDELARRRGAAEAAEQAAKDAVKDANRDVTLAAENIKRLQGRLKTVTGRPRGGLAASLVRARARLKTARAVAKQAQKSAGKLSEARVAAVRLHVAATRRKAVAGFEAALNEARGKVTAARAAHDLAETALTKAEGRVTTLRAQRRQAGRLPYTPPSVHPNTAKVLNDLFPLADTETRVGSGMAAASLFSLDQEALYQVARRRFLDAEDKAFTIHYYNRSRSFVERSINHQYFGLYPASYMWGKVLPEMLRFLLKEPFGIRAPLGGLALSNQVYRTMMIRQNYDEDFRKFMVDNTGAWRMLSLMSPALPWEIPVNAPLWLRRAAELDATRQGRIAAGERPEDVPRLGGPEMANIVTDMLQYAIGPVQSLRYVGGVIGATEDLGNSLFESVNSVLAESGQQLQQDLAVSAGSGPFTVRPGAPSPLTAPWR